MRFRIEQRFDATPEDVLAIYIDPAFYPELEGLPKVSAPEVLSHERTGDRVRMRIRYRFTADLPLAASAVIDPDKLTWVDDTIYDLRSQIATTELLPDHYADRLVASARSPFEAISNDPPRARRRVEGDLQVRMPFVGGQVERAIISGLREHLADEERVAAGWIRSHE